MGFPQWFIDGGQFMYLIVMALFVSTGIIIAAAVSCRGSTKITFMKIAFGFIFLPAIFGALGHYIAYVQILSAVPMVDPSMKQEIYDISIQYARIPSFFGGAGSLFLLFIWMIGYKLCKR